MSQTKERKAGNHKWRRLEDEDKAWACARCGAIARGPGAGPSAAVGGRTYNGKLLSALDKLPRCGDDGTEPSKRKPNTSEKVIRVDIAFLRKALERALGSDYVNGLLKTSDTKLDPGQELEVQRLYAALRVDDLDALRYIDIVRARLSDLRRQRLDAMSNVTLDTDIKHHTSKENGKHWKPGGLP